jgi:Tfp pilus assembly protein PilO
MLPALAIILSIGAYIISVNLLLPDIFQNSAKIEAYDEDIKAAQTKLSSISESENAINKLSTTVNALLLAVPDSVDSPNLITEIETIAAANGVALPNISPPISAEATDASNGLSTNITVVGSYLGITNFINALETNIRFSKLQSLAISNSENTLTATIAFEVFKRQKVSSIIPEVSQ